MSDDLELDVCNIVPSRHQTPWFFRKTGGSPVLLLLPLVSCLPIWIYFLLFSCHSGNWACCWSCWILQIPGSINCFWWSHCDIHNQSFNEILCNSHRCSRVHPSMGKYLIEQKFLSYSSYLPIMMLGFAIGFLPILLNLVSCFLLPLSFSFFFWLIDLSFFLLSGWSSAVYIGIVGSTQQCIGILWSPLLGIFGSTQL